MSKIHDGKLNMDENYPIDEAVKDTEPMIDEEVELALLEAMNIETPDLWDRIQAGINSTSPDQKAPSSDNSSSNVVPFERKEERTTEKLSESSSEETYDKTYGRRQTRRVWTKYVVAAALIMIVMIPVVRVLKDAGSREESAKAESTEAFFYDNAAEPEVY